MEDGEGIGIGALDVDGFKTVNDSYGHAVGDRLIVDIGTTLLGLVGPDGCVARLGGDEFAFLISGQDVRDRIEALSDRIFERFSNPFRIGERTVLVGASIGLAQWQDNADARELKRRADSAMHAAKRAGKMRCLWFDEELDERHAASLLIERELREALATEGFSVVYQPLIDAQDGHVAGVESLLRWTSPTRGDVSPAEFIPIAEQTGLIDKIGLFVLRRACEDGKDWSGLKVAVNVSAAQLRNPELASRVAEILEETGFPVSRLELELTETYLIDDPDTAKRILADLRSLGLSISLDDFGTGYASIGFLRQFQFDKMKLDRSLVVDAQDDEKTRALLLASIAVARALGMTVTAEGIETGAQADLMRLAGCDHFQGWLFAKAMSAQEISLMSPPVTRAA
jgi:diguanylate cyclase (GGDEF)-like protein